MHTVLPSSATRFAVIALLCPCVAPAAAPGPPQRNLCLWLDACRPDTLVTGKGSAVHRWKNLVAGAPGAAQDRDDLRPRLVPDAVNGRAAVRFDGASRLDVPAIREQPGGLTVFVVSRRSPRQASEKKWQRLISCRVPTAKDDRTPPCFQVPAGERGGGGAYGLTVDKTALGGVHIGPLSVGAKRGGTGGGFRGDIAEVLVYDAGFDSPAGMRAVKEYLRKKWGATVSREDGGWTRVGPLGRTPRRVTDALPLSDQDGGDRWEVHQPLTDEFDGEQLDTEKWMPRHPRWKGRKPAFFWNKNVSVRNGALHLTTRKKEAPQMPKGYRGYTSACVHATAPVRYGYFEIEARPMNSAGSSSFWFRNSSPQWVTEIDVFEIGGRSPGYERRVNMNLHVVRTPDEKKHWSCGGRWTAPRDLAADFRVYALDWNEDRIRYYVDGVMVRSVKNTHWHQPLYLIFDSETMPDWFGMPKDKDLPSTYSIRYVRSWKRKK